MSCNVDPWLSAICVGWLPTLSGNLMYETLAGSSVVEVADQFVLYSPGNTKDTDVRQEALLYTALVDINDRAGIVVQLRSVRGLIQWFDR